MTRLPEIWMCLKQNMAKGVWTSIETIYDLLCKITSPLMQMSLNLKHHPLIFPNGKEMFVMSYSTEKGQAKLNGVEVLIIGFKY